MYNSIDLFAGIGGIRLGFDQAFGKDINCVLISERERESRKQYFANFSNDVIINEDITKLNEHDIPSFDICLAGFPCQSFSIAGLKQGFNCENGLLFFDMIRICSYHKPKVIFCENVKNLIYHDKGNTLKMMCNAFEKIGYHVKYKVLNSKNYGVPQNRERIYIVAFRNDIDSSMFEFPDTIDDTKCIRDIVEDAPVDISTYLSQVYLDTLLRHDRDKPAKSGVFHWTVKELDDCACTLTTCNMGLRKNLLHDPREHADKFPENSRKQGGVNNLDYRTYTPRERARLQGFPDDYKIVSCATNAYKQFGNTVTVPVIKAIAENIKKVLDTNTY